MKFGHWDSGTDTVEADADDRAYDIAVAALRSLPDGHALDVDDVARRINTDKLTLVRWLRTDVKIARLVAAKVVATAKS